MLEEDKYVLRHEWERHNGKIYEKINQNEIKHNKEMSELNNKVDKQTTIQQQSFESQARSEKHLEKLSDTMTSIGSEMTDIKYTVKGHDEKINAIQGVIDTKQKGSVQIITVTISTVGVVVAAAFGFAQVFF
nr:hypothetical protein [Staphylococcus sp. NRL 19/737]